MPLHFIRLNSSAKCRNMAWPSAEFSPGRLPGQQGGPAMTQGLGTQAGPGRAVGPPRASPLRRLATFPRVDSQARTMSSDPSSPPFLEALLGPIS